VKREDRRKASIPSTDIGGSKDFRWVFIYPEKTWPWKEERGRGRRRARQRSKEGREEGECCQPLLQRERALEGIVSGTGGKGKIVEGTDAALKKKGTGGKLSIWKKWADGLGGVCGLLKDGKKSADASE